ncbi:hypothetical protein DMUE_0765 [Dictyocoela muelleri]|nr:hypothetical protein DMUE_0765 [Dictyocoela muelleri]
MSKDLSQFTNLLKKLMTRKLLFFGMRISNLSSLIYEEIPFTNNQPTNFNKKSLKQLRDEIRNCKKQIDPKKCAYIVYDFQFYNMNDHYRSLVLLISYIPDEYSTAFERFVYSRESLELMKPLDIQKQVTINNIDDFDYDKLLPICIQHKRN